MAKAWYVVHTFSGFEMKAKESLEERIRRFQVGESFGQILVPEEAVMEVKNGQKRETKRKFFPGYILVEMEITGTTLHVVKDTPRITGFVGSDRNPPSIPAHEVMRITGKLDREKAGPRAVVNYERGEEVRVVDGPLAPIVGRVEEVNVARGRVRVSVTIFGRPTSVELDFAQVEKAT
jgi:transcriptional antiterminator NusG